MRLKFGNQYTKAFRWKRNEEWFHNESSNVKMTTKMKLECENYNTIFHYTNQTTQWRINFNYITCHRQKPSNWRFLMFLMSIVGASQSTNPFKAKMIGPVAHPKMKIRPRRPKSGHKGNHRGNVADNRGSEFRTPLRIPYSSALCGRGRSRHRLVIIEPRRYVATEDEVKDQG